MKRLHNSAPLLEPGDLIIDGGNSFFMDTEGRAVRLRANTSTS